MGPCFYHVTVAPNWEGFESWRGGGWLTRVGLAPRRDDSRGGVHVWEPIAFSLPFSPLSTGIRLQTVIACGGEQGEGEVEVGRQVSLRREEDIGLGPRLVCGCVVRGTSEGYRE